MKFYSNSRTGKSCLLVGHQIFEVKCYSKDQFNKKVGQEYLLKKFLKTIPRECRKDIWIEYFSEHNKSKLKFVK